MSIKQEYKDKFKKIKDFILTVSFIVLVGIALHHFGLLTFEFGEIFMKIKLFNFFYIDLGIIQSISESAPLVNS